MKKFLGSAFWLLLFLGCSKNGDYSITHPTPENLFINNNNANVLDADEIKLKAIDPNIRKLLLTIEEIPELLSVGALYGSEEEMFGRIEDIILDSFNRIYVLDYNKQHIQVFNQKGEFISTVGGKGSGPGEFERARSMAMYKNDKTERLLVSNRYRIEVFEITSDEIKFLETKQFPNVIHSICTSGDRLFAHYIQHVDEENKEGNDSVPMIKAYSLPSFEPLFVFGHSYKSDNPMVVERMSSGNIGCNESSSTVIFGFERMPVLHGYSTEDGELKWKTRIGGLHFSSVIETTEGGRTRLTYKTPESNIMDRLSLPVSFRSKYEIVQVPRRILPDQGYESESDVLTFLVDSSTGSGSLASKRIPEIMHVNGNLIASVSEDYMTCQVHELDVSKK